MSSDRNDTIRIRPEDLPPEDALAARRAEPPRRRGDALPYVALGLGILSILFGGVAIGPIAMICGLAALLRSRGEESRSQLLAAVGIVAGLAGVLLWAALIWHWVGKHGAETGSNPDGASLPVGVGTLDPEAIEKSPPPIRDALLSSVSVILDRKAGSGWVPLSHGSGTVISRSGGRYYVLTCRHVVSSEEGSPQDRRLRLSWIGGEGTDSRVEWQAGAPFDLALLSAAAGPRQGAPRIATIGRAAKLSVGDALFAVGDPLNFRMSYASGALSAVRVLTEGRTPVRVFQTTVPLNPGNSGGGLYNSAGELVGVNSWVMKDRGAEGIGFSVAIDNLWTALADAPAEIAVAIRRLAPAAGPTEPGVSQGEERSGVPAP